MYATWCGTHGPDHLPLAAAVVVVISATPTATVTATSILTSLPPPPDSVTPASAAPSLSSNSSPNLISHSSPALSNGDIAGISIGSIVAAALALVLGVVLWRKRARRRDHDDALDSKHFPARHSLTPLRLPTLVPGFTRVLTGVLSS